jgi:hypothetical protein
VGMRPCAVVAILSLAAAPEVRAQVADSSPFRRLELPTPNIFRSASGAPGAGYWQNTASYVIDARLDTLTHTVSGRETIRYENRSPDTLAFVWLQLDQDIFAAGSINRSAPPPPLLFAGVPFDMAVTGPAGGFTIDSLLAGGRAPATHRYDTMLRLDLAQPLGPGGRIEISLTFRFTIPENGAARMGRDGRLYEVAQWFPRLAVYDDVNGWNTLPYNGPGEFYLEYGDYDVRLTAPLGYIVAGTGTLQNPDEVLTADQQARLQHAMAQDKPVAVITAQEAGTAAARPRARGSEGLLTWHFTARDVRDFAWAAAANFQWDATRWVAGPQDIKLIQTFYRPGAANWGDAIQMAQHAIRRHSEWFTYPYPQASAVEGPIQGMEYPMIVFVPPDTSRHSLSWVLMHELGHEWFPMTVGSDERRYPWMDEGFNSFIDLYTVSEWWQGDAHADSVLNGPLMSYAASATPGQEQPLITAPAEGRNLYWVAYQKPALMMRLLREEVLGREAFDAAFKEYIRRWRFRHPQPADFFRTMENVSGRELDWFWREWVYTTARLDQSVDSVNTGARGHGGTVRIVLGNRRDMVMPVEVKLNWNNGTSETRRIPVEMWNYGRRHAFTVPAEGRTLVRVEVDPRRVYPDVERRNNVWVKRQRG